MSTMGVMRLRKRIRVRNQKESKVITIVEVVTEEVVEAAGAVEETLINRLINQTYLRVVK